MAEKNKWHYEDGYYINLSQWKREYERRLNNMSEKPNDAMQASQKLYGFANGEILPKKSNTVLDLRFIVLPSGVVMEVLFVEGVALNLTPNVNKSPLSEIYRAWEYTDDCAIYTYCSDLFPELKSALTEFANSNAFFGDEKPVPRIEPVDADNDEFIIVSKEKAQSTITRFHKRIIEQIIGHEIPIYKPKRFKSEWVKEFPREFKMPSSYGGVMLYAGSIDEAKHEQNSDVEIWRFTMNEAD